MKNTLLILAYCLVTFGAAAQSSKGTIEYKETIKLEINLDHLKDVTDEMKAMFPNEQTSNHALYFNPEASLYTNADNAESQDIDYKSDEEDVEIKIKMDAPERSYYKSLKSKEVVESRDLFGKKFLITGGKKIKWKMTTESKEILGYACTKATTTDDEGFDIEAWFTTAIPVSIGPGGFHYLPGAVLAVSMNEGKRTITATKVDLENVDATKIVKPKKGKKVTNEQFKKIVEEKQKEMAEIYGGKGNIIIKTETIEE